MVYDVIFLNSWVIMLFLQKFLPKKLIKITFWKRVFWVQTALLNSCQSNTKVFQKALFCQKAHTIKHPIVFSDWRFCRVEHSLQYLFQVWGCKISPMLSLFLEFRFFKESSDEEREHAEKFMKYQVLNNLFYDM